MILYNREEIEDKALGIFSLKKLFAQESKFPEVEDMHTRTFTFKKGNNNSLKNSKYWLTILFCTNIDNSDKRTPTATEKSQKPRCYINVKI